MSGEPTEELAVACVPKNRNETIRVRLIRIGTRWCIDTRTFFRTADSGEAPSRKGITASVSSLRSLIEALEAAERLAIERGLIGGQHGA